MTIVLEAVPVAVYLVGVTLVLLARLFRELPR